jgi:hypothetical protein
MRLVSDFGVKIGSVGALFSFRWAPVKSSLLLVVELARLFE